MVSLTDPVNMTLKTGEVVKGPGKIIGVYDTTGVRVTATGANEIGIGISAGASSRDADGALDTNAGATVAVYPMGATMYVQSLNGLTWSVGDLVYADANGLASQTSSSQKVIGVYVGEGELTTTALVVNGAGDSGATEGNMILVATSGAATA
ncbi:MAG: hypothetical protein CMC15_14120 [Flavobacteriaceae bacterium]|nr:hypothetical protein [Flavobacteriaceae bacterium]|tara:strand:+ start:96 stop:551 length:456 start_codon:yes stop_codon:yes gene_type:complete